MASVFVVDREAFFAGSWPQGFHAISKSEAPDFLARAWAAGRFVDRAEAEVTPAWKQWIPYCVLRCRAGHQAAAANPPEAGIFMVQRSPGQTEARLHDSWSIGLGGHVDPEDGDPAGATTGAGFFLAALGRELREELDLTHGPRPEPRFLGLLNDDRTEVGSVHAGLAYAWDLPLSLEAARRAVQIREISKMHGGFGSLVELRKLWQDPSLFESWSKFLILAGVADPMGASGSA